MSRSRLAIMCPLFPLHLFIMYALVLGPLWFLSTAVIAQVAIKTEKWGVQFNPTEVLELEISHQRTVQADFDQKDLENHHVKAISNNGHIAEPGPVLIEPGLTNWTASFNLSGKFIGYADIRLQLIDDNNNEIVKESDPLKTTVIREDRIIDHIFVGSVATLVSIIYINFGCALDWSLVRGMLKKPVGPAIGFVAQFIFMPLLSFGLGKAIFPGNAPMQLGMFFTGVSPAGGASNIWTVALGGNMNLSITMTTISTFAAFAMMPFWIFTLGSQIFAEGNIAIPYARIASFAFGLVVPLGIGFLIQRYLPKVSRFMVRILKPFAAFLILFIIIFAIITNLYLFELFSWRIIIAGLGLPWLGFMFGMIASWIFKQPPTDILAIAVETGIQNTGIAIFLLSALGQPEGDLTTVIPVSVAIMTPFPLMILFVYLKCRGRKTKHIKMEDLPEENGKNDEENQSSLGSTANEPFANKNVTKY